MVTLNIIDNRQYLKTLKDQQLRSKLSSIVHRLQKIILRNEKLCTSNLVFTSDKIYEKRLEIERVVILLHL